jgi:hypothetical protein
MLCNGCGNGIPDRAAFCPLCGAPIRDARSLDRSSIRSPSNITEKQGESSAWIIIAVVVVIFGVTALVALFRNSSDTQQVQKSKQPEIGQPVTNVENATKPVDVKQQIISDARKTARENYIHGLREAFRNNGADASVSDTDGELAIVSDALKLKPDRDQLMRQQFGPTVRRSLCTMGFKTIALKSGVILGDGDSYSLGCPETKAETESRRQEERSARQKYVDDLQRDFNTDSQQEEIHVSERGNELILTGRFAKGTSPGMLRAMWTAKFVDQAQENLCGIGFRGLRLRGDVDSSGTFISFGCERNPR